MNLDDDIKAFQKKTDEEAKKIAEEDRLKFKKIIEEQDFKLPKEDEIHDVSIGSEPLEKPKDNVIVHDFKKIELIIGLSVLALAIGIGIFLIFDNRDYVQSLIDNPPPFGDIFTPREVIEEEKIITEEGSMIVYPVERTPREFNPQEQNDQTPLPIDPTVTTDEFSQLLSDNAFIIYSDGDWKAEYLDGGNIPIETFGDGYKILIFDCWNDFGNIKHFFGVFQIIDATFLQVDMNIIGAYPSFSETIAQGQSITWEGICP